MKKSLSFNGLRKAGAALTLVAGTQLAGCAAEDAQDNTHLLQNIATILMVTGSLGCVAGFGYAANRFNKMAKVLDKGSKEFQRAIKEECRSPRPPGSSLH